MRFLQVGKRNQDTAQSQTFLSCTSAPPHPPTPKCVHTKLLITSGLVGGYCSLTESVYFYLRSPTSL